MNKLYAWSFVSLRGLYFTVSPMEISREKIVVKLEDDQEDA